MEAEMVGEKVEDGRERRKQYHFRVADGVSSSAPSILGGGDAAFGVIYEVGGGFVDFRCEAENCRGNVDKSSDEFVFITAKSREEIFSKKNDVAAGSRRGSWRSSALRGLRSDALRRELPTV